MYCKNCGNEILTNQKFCRNCGYRLTPNLVEGLFQYIFYNWKRILTIGIVSLVVILLIICSYLYINRTVTIQNALNGHYNNEQVIIVKSLNKNLIGKQDAIQTKLASKYYNGTSSDVVITKTFIHEAIILNYDNKLEPKEIVAYLSEPQFQFKKSNATDTDWISTGLNEKFIKSAKHIKDSDDVIEITFTREGAKLLYNLTKEVVNKQLAIFWGDKLVFSPIVREPIKNGKVQISGLSDNFDVDEIDKLVDILNSGVDMQMAQIK